MNQIKVSKPEVSVGQIYRDSSKYATNNLNYYIVAKVSGCFCLISLGDGTTYSGLLKEIEDIFCDGQDHFVLVNENITITPGV